MIVNLILSFLLLILGLAVILTWLVDINAHREVDLSAGFFHARERSSNNLFWFHITAEMINGLLLILSGIVLLLQPSWGMPVVSFTLGALFYASLNSLGWVFAQRERYRYAVPILSGLLISMLAMLVLMLSDQVY